MITFKPVSGNEFVFTCSSGSYQFVFSQTRQCVFDQEFYVPEWDLVLCNAFLFNVPDSKKVKRLMRVFACSLSDKLMGGLYEEFTIEFEFVFNHSSKLYEWKGQSNAHGTRCPW